jgi:hypothetical protein
MRLGSSGVKSPSGSQGFLGELLGGDHRHGFAAHNQHDAVAVTEHLYGVGLELSENTLSVFLGPFDQRAR